MRRIDQNITLKKSKNNLFSDRHIGTTQEDRNSMLEFIGYKSMDQFIKSVIPSNILEQGKINLGQEKTEEEALAELKKIAAQNPSKSRQDQAKQLADMLMQ